MVILFSIIAVALCLNVAVTYQLKRLMSGCAGEIKDLRRIQPVMQGQITAVATILTHVINGMDDAERETVNKTVKSFLQARGNVDPSVYGDEDKVSFNNAFRMMLRAVVEEINAPPELVARPAPAAQHPR
jgi:hypothetical protein